MTLQEIITDILEREGWPKFTERKADYGGASKGPITIQTLREWRHPSPVTIADLKKLSEPECRQILERKYATPYNWITYEPLRILCIDFAVTHWHDDVVRALQTCAGVKVDGVLGPVTRKAVLTHSPIDMHLSVWRYRQKRFVEVAFDKHVMQFLKDCEETQLHNLRGWLNRNLKVL